MRIITGSARGKALITLTGDATRPTSERMKEAMFSSIQFEIEGRRVLDLFAGSGQLGLEALSRGALSAMFVDMSADAIACVKKNAQSTGFFGISRFLVSDYRNYIRKAASRDRFDLIFIDPPYALAAVPEALRRLHESGLLLPNALLVTESGEADVFGGDAMLATVFETVRYKKYGPSHVSILRYTQGKEDEQDA